MARSDASLPHLIRLRMHATGVVQGVGFRPYIFQIANASHVTGNVANVGGGVKIEVEGQVSAVRKFVSCLREKLPRFAEIHSLQIEELPPVGNEEKFSIVSSICESGAISILPDLGVCEQCLREMRDPSDRRSNHALITCTQCGPRFSIIRNVPFDRANTTLAEFPLCEDCAREYGNSKDRRLHAQSMACPNCGPRVELLDAKLQPTEGEPIEQARGRLLRGEIVAIKGIGGFHLAARADDPTAIARLRHEKHRDAKPFAVMVKDIAHAKQIVELSVVGEEVIQSTIAPIVIAPALPNAPICPEVAPGLRQLGILLPYTPIQHLLFNGEMVPLAMTSANDSGEPILFDNADAAKHLLGCFDAMLWHDRPIARGIDDSVLIDIGECAPIMLRRARGYVPTEIKLPIESPEPGLAIGGELKNAFALVQNSDVILSQHIGDLSDAGSFERFTESIDDFLKLFECTPKWIARDAHPRYFSSQHAGAQASRLQVPLITVQHHHAHAASVLAENNHKDAALALICDGTGYGADGTIWGGELLLADLKGYRRLARLRPLRLPGGDAAARDTSRCAMAMLYDAYGKSFVEKVSQLRLIENASDRQLVELMLLSNVSCAQSSGAGRYFDGFSALLGLCGKNTFEGHAAMLLESAAGLASNVSDDGDRFEIREVDGLLELSFAPLIRDLCEKRDSRSTEQWAAEFHEQFALGWLAVIDRIAPKLDVRTVAVSGGVFCNARLVHRLTNLLEAHHLQVLRNRLVPPNDGGLAYGQAAIAAAVLQERGLSSQEIVCV